jgi:hypothetical protein
MALQACPLELRTWLLKAFELQPQIISDQMIPDWVRSVEPFGPWRAFAQPITIKEGT